jgi:NADP-dependent 3-hydroxy acid dehydrogenase YdfG
MGEFKHTAWITGGGSGIGFAAAKAAGALGYRTVLSGRNGEKLKKAVEKLNLQGMDSVYAVMDVADKSQVKSAFADISEKYGDVSLLVCSAGTNIQKRRWSDMDIEGFEQVLNTNLNGVVHPITLVLPGMRKQKDGLIIIISSWAGWVYSPGGGAAYSGSKTALGSIAVTINDQEGRNGIRACNICPGEVDTEIIRTRPRQPLPGEREKMLKADDIGRVIEFVASTPSGVCLNEIVISPTWNRNYIGIAENSDKGL